MAVLHAVYRSDWEHGCRWRGWLPAQGIALGADTLGHAQRLMSAAVARNGQREQWVEHTEHPVGDGLWVRQALDERVLEREHATRVLMEALDDQRLRARLATLPDCLLGGVVVCVCVPGDTLEWILGQHDGQGALVVAAAVTNHQVWWNALTGATHTGHLDLPVAGSLAELDLTDPDTTVDDWITTTDCGRVVTRAPTSGALIA
ncbi:hypothetical protein [Saccharopolyspora shandongensis]|uniref:hypothetical protein n=1 Tax=Saccharopolyspora shandongensis TaxID=418495 RepID=UPI0033F9F961